MHQEGQNSTLAVQECPGSEGQKRITFKFSFLCENVENDHW